MARPRKIYTMMKRLDAQLQAMWAIRGNMWHTREDKALIRHYIRLRIKDLKLGGTYGTLQGDDRVRDRQAT